MTQLAAYIGLSNLSGEAIAGEAHLRQSIRDILTTPIGSRVMNRTYGSRIPRLLDRPISKALVADIVAATAEALARWEPRINLKRVQVYEIEAGRITADLDVTLNGRGLTLERVL